MMEYWENKRKNRAGILRGDIAVSAPSESTFKGRREEYDRPETKYKTALCS